MNTELEQNIIHTGDAKELSWLIPDESVDLIFCDPPYLKANVESGIYTWLAEEAARMLKPGGFCLAYTGVYWLADALRDMSKSLEYYWTYITLQEELAPTQWNRKTQNRYKPILAFCKGSGVVQKHVMDVVRSSQDKKFHVWGQSPKIARYYLECFSNIGALVYDPFAGGGTVPYACRQLNRRFIAFEIDPETANTARKRLETVQPLLIPETLSSTSLWTPETDLVAS